jgi:hypothetical protein
MVYDTQIYWDTGTLVRINEELLERIVAAPV